MEFVATMLKPNAAFRCTGSTIQTGAVAVSSIFTGGLSLVAAVSINAAAGAAGALAGDGVQAACECGYEKKDLKHVAKEKQNEYNDGIAKAIGINAGFGAVSGALVPLVNAGVDKCIAAPHANAVHPVAVMPAAAVTAGGAGHSTPVAKIVANCVVAAVPRVSEEAIKDVNEK